MPRFEPPRMTSRKLLDAEEDQREILSNVVDRGLIKRQPFDPFSLGQFPAFHL